MDRKRRWSAAAVWLLAVFCVLYTLPTVAGKKNLPEWYTGFFSDELNYGLDLQGGLELRYTVDWKKAIEDNGQKFGSSIRARLVERLAQRDNKNPANLARKQRETYADKVEIDTPSYTRVRVRFDDAETAKLIGEDTLREMNPGYEGSMGAGRYAIERLDDRTFELRMKDEAVAQIRRETVKKTRKLIAQRVEAFGLVQPDVRIAGTSDIVVQIPGVGKEEMDVVRRRIGQTAQLTFRMIDSEGSFFADQESALDSYKSEQGGGASSLSLIDGPTGKVFRADSKYTLVRFVESLDVPDDHVVGYEQVEVTDGGVVEERYWQTRYLFQTIELSGDHLANAQVMYDQKGMPYVSLDLDAEGGRKFGELTAQNVGEQMAIMLDRTLESAPSIDEKIPGGRVKITMGGAGGPQSVLEEARSLVTVLNQGAYKAPVYKVHDHEVGASLGKHAVQAGKTSILVGTLAIIVFVMLYYRLAGVIAVVGLLFNLVLVLALLISFNSALTLPGMAGIILTVGMAVDANIIVFERIREELRGGRSPRPAVDTGYSKALSTVLDANITTAVAGAILLNYTTGPIRGFAITLLMGIVCAVFTAVYVSRRIFNWYLGRRRPQTTLSI